jgi:hydroxypyruvate reductase/glycerate 2-kinase
MARRLRDDAITIWNAGVAAVDPYRLVREAVLARPEIFTSADHIAVVGAGKAGAAMARALEDSLPDHELSGLVNVPDATVEPLRYVELHAARSRTDNRPTEAGVEGAVRILDIAESLDEDDLLLVLLSGGGSALLPLPVKGVSLQDMVRMTALLQERGVPIHEMNAVRKHLSRIKGGRLAQATGARVVGLILSDVQGDCLATIASGPTAPDPTTFADALTVLDRHGLRSETPASIREHLNRGAAARVEETPEDLPARVVNVVIGNNGTARKGAAAAARSLGYEVVDHGEFYGDAEAFPAWLGSHLDGITAAGRVCALSGGEITVRLPGEHGMGGRNQHSVLQVLTELGSDGFQGRCFLSAGTDGEDGPTDAAGAVADESLVQEVIRRGLDAAGFRERHDAYRFFDSLGGLLRTGPTGTNVMDLRVVLIST